MPEKWKAGSVNNQTVGWENLFTNADGDLEEIDWEIYPMSKKYKIPKSEERKIRENVHNQIWVCRDGSEVKISDMGTNHLFNTIAMLERGDNPEHPVNVEYLRMMKLELKNRTEEGRARSYP